MATIPPGILDQFGQLMKYPIKAYLNRYAVFVELHRQNIYNYYAGKTKGPNAKSFAELSHLLTESQRLENIIENKRNSLNNGAYWVLAELLSDILIELETTSNASKWLRSAIGKNVFTPGVEVEYTLRQLQTLEQVAGDIVGSSSRDQEWVTIALRNDLREEDYDTEGGNILAISGKNNATIKLNSVVDNISGKKVYGLDIDKKLQFVDDDLKALSYDDTIKQAVGILGGLRRGMTPEFPTDGVGAGSGVGTNRSSMAFPILMRQLSATFRRDDTLQALSIKSIKLEQDALFMTFEVTTRLGELLQNDTQL